MGKEFTRICVTISTGWFAFNLRENPLLSGRVCYEIVIWQIQGEEGVQYVAQICSTLSTNIKLSCELQGINTLRLNKNSLSFQRRLLSDYVVLIIARSSTLYHIPLLSRSNCMHRSCVSRSVHGNFVYMEREIQIADVRRVNPWETRV